ncbi:ABC transporter permease [bacterium]|nr:ABC transporter permease [bacterium]
MEEIWSQNLLNVFATPLRVREWLAAACVTACIRGTIPFLVVSFVAYFLFGANVLTVGWFIIPFVILMLMSSWWIGLVAAWFIISFGRQVAVLIWALGWFFGTFCGLWGPVSILPRALQYVAWSLPMTYVFESLRALILNQPVFLSYLVIAFVLNLLYLSITIYVFRVLFNYSRSRGFTRLM